MRKSLRFTSIATLALLGGCEAANTQSNAEDAGGSMAGVPANEGSAPGATPDDVREALQCHLSLSMAMAKQITTGSPKRHYGAALTYWHTLATERARAAGMKDVDFSVMRANVQEDFRRAEENEETQAFTQKCYDAAPSG